MRGNLIPTTVYLDRETKRKVDLLALTMKKPKAAIVREALGEGLKVYNPPHNNSAQALLELAEEVRELLKGEKLPSDLSENHDYYTWGGEKRKKK